MPIKLHENTTKAIPSQAIPTSNRKLQSQNFEKELNVKALIEENRMLKRQLSEISLNQKSLAAQQSQKLYDRLQFVPSHNLPTANTTLKNSVNISQGRASVGFYGQQKAQQPSEQENTNSTEDVYKQKILKLKGKSKARRASLDMQQNDNSFIKLNETGILKQHQSNTRLLQGATSNRTLNAVEAKQKSVEKVINRVDTFKLQQNHTNSEGRTTSNQNFAETTKRNSVQRNIRYSTFNKQAPQKAQQVMNLCTTERRNQQRSPENVYAPTVIKRQKFVPKPINKIVQRNNSFAKGSNDNEIPKQKGAEKPIKQTITSGDKENLKVQKKYISHSSQKQSQPIVKNKQPEVNKIRGNIYLQQENEKDSHRKNSKKNRQQIKSKDFNIEQAESVIEYIPSRKGQIKSGAIRKVESIQAPTGGHCRNKTSNARYFDNGLLKDEDVLALELDTESLASIEQMMYSNQQVEGSDKNAKVSSNELKNPMKKKKQLFNAIYCKDD